jgi:hypothetical protein
MGEHETGGCEIKAFVHEWQSGYLGNQHMQPWQFCLRALEHSKGLVTANHESRSMKVSGKEAGHNTRASTKIQDALAGA